ncbi:MAG: hypothetical protein WCY29_15805 [Novosphingobium sp.]
MPSNPTHARAYNDGARIAAELTRAIAARTVGPSELEKALFEDILKDVELYTDTKDVLLGFITTIENKLMTAAAVGRDEAFFGEPVSFTDASERSQRLGQNLALDLIAGVTIGRLAATATDTPTAAVLRQILDGRAMEGVYQIAAEVPPAVARRLDGFAFELHRALALG